MGNPVVHFEIHGKNATKLSGFYRELFDWDIEVMQPMNYGFTKTGSETGINGGITASDMAPATMVYVQVPDINAHLAKIEAAGGKTVMPRTEIPDAVTMAIFTDPAGNNVGLVEG